ncbi:MAG: helix-turn-helix domain-containing protein [Streptosporangiales bacterium]|nr:helix-turn-helix domain-containing protein [Streptosporangiales bacterium]
MNDSIGDRIAIYRKRKGIGQKQLAELVGRSESWLSQVERGLRSVDKLSVLTQIAKVLDVDVQELSPHPWRYSPEGGTQLRTLAAIRTALTDYSHLLGTRETMWPLAQFRAAVVQAHQDYQAAQYDKVSAALPDLLTVADGYGDASPEVQMAKSSAYVVASKLLAKVGEAHLAWVTADRAATAALTSESMEAQGQAAYQVVCALLRADRTEDAERVAVSGAERLMPLIKSEEPGLTSVAGSLWLISGVIAARNVDRRTSQDRLDRAEALGHELRKDANLAWTAFGPTNVNIHRVSAATEMGDPYEVLSLAGFIDTDALPEGLRSRRAQVHLDLAWAQAQQKRDPEAVLHLVEAERVAPELLRYGVIPREIISTLLKRERRGRTPALRPIARRAGILT